MYVCGCMNGVVVAVIEQGRKPLASPDTRHSHPQDTPDYGYCSTLSPLSLARHAQRVRPRPVVVPPQRGPGPPVRRESSGAVQRDSRAIRRVDVQRGRRAAGAGGDRGLLLFFVCVCDRVGVACYVYVVRLT
jgi:hypothetical protein